MKKPITKVNGRAEWEHLDGDSYLVTGVDRNGKRFTIRASSWRYASGINVWRGNKWLVRDGKRYLIT
jgi:hypothetical protein